MAQQVRAKMRAIWRRTRRSSLMKACNEKTARVSRKGTSNWTLALRKLTSFHASPGTSAGISVPGDLGQSSASESPRGGRLDRTIVERPRDALRRHQQHGGERQQGEELHHPDHGHESRHGKSPPWEGLCAAQFRWAAGRSSGTGSGVPQAELKWTRNAFTRSDLCRM